MYCKNCGKQIIDDSKFCYNCGQKIIALNAPKTIETSKSPDTLKPLRNNNPITAPETIKAQKLPAMVMQQNTKHQPKQKIVSKSKKPYTSKNKKHGFSRFAKIVMFLLLSTPILIFIILLIMAIYNNSFQKNDTTSDINEINRGKSVEKLSKEDIENLYTTTNNQNNSTDAAAITTTLESTPAPTLEVTPIPTQDNNNILKEFPTPVFEANTPIYTVLLDNTWELVGFAHNPNKLNVDLGLLTLEGFDDYMQWFIFYRDESMLWMIDSQGEYIEMELFYEIMDVHYIDTLPFEDNTGMRFYLGNDGLLYMCEYEGDENHGEFSDFYVLKPISLNNEN